MVSAGNDKYSHAEPSAEGFDCSPLDEASFDEARPKARACDIEVKVTRE